MSEITERSARQEDLKTTSTQQPPSGKSDSTWGKFSTKQAAKATKTQLQEVGISPDKITIETEDFQPPIRLEDTDAIANLKVGAIAGGVLGFLVGLSLSLILTNFASEGLAAFNNWQTIHYLAPVMGAIVGAAGIGLMSGISGGNVPRNRANVSESNDSPKYLVVVQGAASETDLAREIILRQGGVVEEADRR